MLRPLYDWTLRLSAHPRAMLARAAISFAESSFFPVPPDVLLIPMVLADRTKAWRIATVCTVCSVIGGMFGYAIGYFLYETIGQWVIGLYGLQGQADRFRAFYDEW